VSLSAIPRALRDHVFARDMGHCRYCRLSQVGQGSIFHINHILPRSRGGLTVESNLVLQCPSCSLHKSDKVSALDPDSGEEIPLFHPLDQVWSEHFWITENGQCFGKTPVGRATIRALRMNDQFSQLARALQIRLGLLRIGP
jgi:HNH endonuclease